MSCVLGQKNIIIYLEFTYLSRKSQIIVKKVFLLGVLEFASLNGTNTFEINGHRVKTYCEDKDRFTPLQI